MKKGMKRLVSCLLAIAMVLTTFGVNTKTALAEERTMQNYVYNGYEVTFDVTDAWDGAFNAEVKLANTGDAEICDWALTFEFAHEIQNLWNATVVEHTGDTYVIKNADWNANIKPGEGVAFGMTVLCNGEIAFPENFSFVMEEESVTAQSYSAEFTLYSDWGTGCNGAIILSNLTDEPIENWQLEFDYNREIVDIANAVIVSHEQGHYVLKNAEYNADIAANSSVHISIVAGEGAADERPENFTMQQTVVGDASTGTEDEMDPVIAERLKGVKYKEPEAEHVQYDEVTDMYYVDNQLLVVTKEGVTQEEVEAFVADYGATVVGYIVLTGDYQLEFQEPKTLDELNFYVERISESVLVEYVMIHELIEVCESATLEWYDDATERAKWDEEWDVEFPYGANWGLEAIDAMGAWEYEGSTVKVGMVDSSFDVEHEDLDFEDVWGNPEDVIFNYEKSFTKKEGITHYSHGTNMAGILAAIHNNKVGMKGTAKNVELYAAASGLNIESEVEENLEAEAEFTRSSFIKTKCCFSWLILNDCRVINYSMRRGNIDEKLTNKEQSIYKTFFERLINNGYDFLIVQSAGNEGKESSLYGGIASIQDSIVEEHIIEVGAVKLNAPYDVSNLFGIDYSNIKTRDGKTFTGYSYWADSNYGEGVDVCAPGADIYSTLPGNRYSNIFDITDEVLYWGGSSQAAAYVSGVAALCFSVNPELTATQVKDIICEKVSRYICDRNRKFYPMVNARLATEAAVITPGEIGNIDRNSVGILQGQVLSLESQGPTSYGVASALDTSKIKETGSLPYIRAIPLTVNGELDNKNLSSSKLFDADEKDIPGFVDEDNKNGSYELMLSEGRYRIEVFVPGYVEKIYPDVWIAGDSVQLMDILLIPDGLNDEGTNTEEKLKLYDVKGVIKTAESNQVVSNVTVSVIKGGYMGSGDSGEVELDITQHDVIETFETGADGRYSLQLPRGYYILKMEKEGYITSYKEIISAPYIYEQNAALSSILEDGEYRIVLQWGESPRDLDSHLIGKKQEYEVFHVYYSNKYYYEGEILIAQLDIDDVSGYGPETTTVTVTVNREMDYQYYVKDYTNQYNSYSKALSLSGATVSVYCGTQLLETYSVPLNKTGTVWNVFEIIDGELVDINQIR